MGSLIIAGISLVILIWATQPEELRENRWAKIVPSVFIIWIIVNLSRLGVAGRFLSAMISISLAFLWAPLWSYYISGWFMNRLYRFSTDEGGFRIDYTEARIHIEERHFEKAIKEVQNQLRKDPLNYEGHVLLAGLYRELQKPVEAAAELTIIINNPDATEDQKAVARAGKQELIKEFDASFKDRGKE